MRFAAYSTALPTLSEDGEDGEDNNESQIAFRTNRVLASLGDIQIRDCHENVIATMNIDFVAAFLSSNSYVTYTITSPSGAVIMKTNRMTIFNTEYRATDNSGNLIATAQLSFGERVSRFWDNDANVPITFQ